MGFDALISRLATPLAGGWQAPLVALVAAAWLALATLSLVRASRAGIEARAARAWAMRLRGLMTSLPAGYIIVGADGSATASEQVRRWLGVGRIARFDDLGGDGVATGLLPAELAVLRTHVDALGVTGEPFETAFHTAGGAWFVAHGTPASVEVAGQRGSVVWLRESSAEFADSRSLRTENLALAASVAANTAMLAAMPTPMWRRDAAQALVVVNDAYARSVGAASPEQAVAAGIELMADGARALARRAVAADALQACEEPVIIAEARRILRIVETPLAGGGTGGLAIDVTDREDARAERDRLERAQTDTLDRLSASVAQFAADRTLTFFNSAFAGLFKLDAAWLSERPEFDRVLERMRDAGRLPEQRDFPSWRAVRRGWFTNATRAIEETWPLPDTSIIHVIAQPHPDGGLLMVFEDRSEQLRLASSRDTLLRVQQATLDHLHEGVAVFGADGRVQFSNARFAEIWGYDQVMLATRPYIDEMIEKTASMVLDSARGAELRQVIRRTTGIEGRETFADRIALTDGRMIDFAAVPLPDGNALFTYLDVSDSARIQQALRDRNEALEAADRLKNAFVSNVSYELRTPLTAISGFGEMLSAGYAGPLNARQTDYTLSILASSQRLQLLIDDILDLAGTEAGELELDVATVDLGPLIEASVGTVLPDAEAKGLTMMAAVFEAGKLQADERRLRQILHNLLMNALRFTPSGGQITVEARGQSDQVAIVVRDSGIGIPEAEQGEIFERFRKGSNAGPQGIGLGLALVREFVSLHYGRVELWSQVGKGTTVTVRLPRRHDAPRLDG